MVRFIHTADWQMGFEAKEASEIGDKLREARFETIEKIVRVAREREVDFLLIAGDLFESNYISPRIVREVLASLSSIQPIPVLVLPGNHDPFDHSSIYRSKTWELAGKHIRLLLEPLELAGAIICPSPLFQKNSTEDPSEKIEFPSDNSKIKLAVLHGSLAIESRYQHDDFPIATDVDLRLGADYVALGHWHSTFKLNERVYYSGTPEPTSFSEKDSGNVLLVEIEKPGAPPHVEKIEVKTLTWLEKKREIIPGSEEETIDALLRELRSLPERHKTLLRIRLQGHANPEFLRDPEEFFRPIKDEFLFFDLKDEVSVAPEPSQIDRITGDSLILKDILERLMELTALLKENGKAKGEAAYLVEAITRKFEKYPLDLEKSSTEALRLLARLTLST